MRPFEESKVSTYLSLSSFYFFFFALLGGFAPYLPLYLDDLGFSHYDIGVLMSVLLITKVLAPNLWSWIGDHSGKRLFLVRAGSFLSFLFFCGMLFVESFWALIFVIAGFSFFWNAILPQYEVVTLFNLGKDRRRYSLIRVWGSIGFIITVYCLGFVFNVFSIRILPWVLCAITLMIWLTSLSRVKERQKTTHEPLAGLFNLIKQPGVIAFFVINFLLQVSHGPYYTFFSLYLENIGYSKSLIGSMWALGVLAEVILFLFMAPLLHRFSLRQLIIVSLFLTTLRWLITALYGENTMLLFTSQLAHAASFGVMHVVAIHYINEHFDGEHEGQGQALYSSLSFGLGGAAGAYFSGYLAEMVALSTLFFYAAGISLVAMIIALLSNTATKQQQCPSR